MPKQREEIGRTIDQRAFGEKVYKARIGRHMQVSEVAGNLGVSEIFVRQIELGRKLPSLNVFMNLCNVLQASPTYFLSSELELNVSDPVQKAIEVLSACTPREGEIIMAMLQAAADRQGR